MLIPVHISGHQISITYKLFVAPGLIIGVKTPPCGQCPVRAVANTFTTADAFRAVGCSRRVDLHAAVMGTGSAIRTQLLIMLVIIPAERIEKPINGPQRA